MILETVIGALVGSIIGSAIGNMVRRPKKPGPVGPVPAVCSCVHGYGIHEDGKACGGQIQRTRSGNLPGFEWVPCPCKVYDGPEPLPRLWVLNERGELS
jgi:hypothetical protein